MTALTAAERDLILAGARHLVVPGDPGCEGCHDRWTHAKIHGDEGWLPPQRWVEATGPCEHTNTTTPVYNGGNYGNYGTRRCKDCGATRDDWSDWTGGDGRKRVALAAVCPMCHGSCCDSPCLAAHPDDGRPHNPCPTCGRDGSVVFAHATVEVLPVVTEDQGRKIPVPRVEVTDQCLVILFNRPHVRTLILDPLPVPGRDFVVLLDDVETIGEPI